jgi:hypothetical protein
VKRIEFQNSAERVKDMNIAAQLDRERKPITSAVMHGNTASSASIQLVSYPDVQQADRSQDHLLEAWKDIASYMRRDIRTVQRWEKLYELPIYRLQDSRSGSVFAYKRELDAWRQRRAVQVMPDHNREPVSSKSGETASLPAAGTEAVRIQNSFPWPVALLSALIGAISSAAALELMKVVH